jgi:hypothetical protein
VQPLLVQPFHPAERRELALIGGAAQAVDIDALRLLESDRGLVQDYLILARCGRKRMTVVRFSG